MPTLATNRQACYQYQILQKFEAGIALQGWEVKSIRNHRLSLRESFVKFIGRELFLINAYIPPYQKTKNLKMDAHRSRKLLLKKDTILSLSAKIKQKGSLTIVPLKVYTKRKFLKVEIGLAKGKKGFEKRRTEKKEAIKKRMYKEAKDALR